MKNRVSVLTILSVILLMVAKVAVGAATMVAQRGAEHDFRFREPALYKPAKTTSTDQYESLMHIFKKADGTGKTLIHAAILSDGLTADRYEEFQLEDVLQGLDYVHSKSLRFAIPGTRYVVVLDWGFGGAGEHNLEFMLPLPTVPFKVELNEDVSATIAGRDGALVGFGKMLMENELNKVARDGDLGKVLQGLGVSPILKPRAIFLLKLALLIQHTFKTQDINFFANELGFLLCRLVLSGDINMPGLKDSSLTMLLPKGLVDAINGKAPHLLEVVDSMFASSKKLFSGINNDEALAGFKTLTYVFDGNATVAQEFKEVALTMLDDEDCQERLEAFFASKHLQVLDWDDFCEIQNGGTAVRGFSFNVGRMISYGNDASALVDCELLTPDQAAQLGKPGTVYTAQKGKFTVVCCRTDKASFDMPQTFSVLAASVAKAWGQYMTIVRNEVAQGHDLVDADELLLEDVRERQMLRKFLKSEKGELLSERLEHALKAARDPFEKVRLAFKKAERELNEKVASRAVLAQRGNQRGMAAVIANLDAQIAQLKKNVACLKEQLNENETDATCFEIDELMQVLKSQHSAGKGIDHDLRSRVEELQRELAVQQETAAKLQTQIKLSDDEKLKLRDAVMDVYEQEFIMIGQELDKLSRGSAFGVETLARMSELEVYKKFLEVRVKRMQDQQVGLRKLMAYRSAVAQGVMLTTERQKEFYDLERTLGFVFAANNPVDVCRVTKVQPSIAKRFIQEIAQPAYGSVFEPMHQDFIKALSTIMRRSDFAKNNIAMVKYALSLLFPAAQGVVLERILQGARV